MNHGISSTAKTLGMTPDTLRYYEKLRLLAPTRNEAGLRLYSERDFARLRFLKRAQALGFSLGDIRQLLQLRESPGRSSRAVRELARRKLDELDTRLRVTRQMHSELTELLGLCSGAAECCPILDRMDGGQEHPVGPGGSRR